MSLQVKGHHPLAEIIAKCLTGIEGDFPVKAKLQWKSRCVRKAVEYHEQEIEKIKKELTDTRKQWDNEVQTRHRYHDDMEKMEQELISIKNVTWKKIEDSKSPEDEFNILVMKMKGSNELISSSKFTILSEGDQIIEVIYNLGKNFYFLMSNYLSGNSHVEKCWGIKFPKGGE
jgi:hypothetical protein